MRIATDVALTCLQYLAIDEDTLLCDLDGVKIDETALALILVGNTDHNILGEDNFTSIDILAYNLKFKPHISDST